MDFQRRASSGDIAASTTVRPPLGNNRSRWTSGSGASKGDGDAALPPTHGVDGPPQRQSSSAGAPISLMRRPSTQHTERRALRGSPWAWGDHGLTAPPSTTAAAPARPSTRHNVGDTAAGVAWHGERGTGSTMTMAATASTASSSDSDAVPDLKTGVLVSGRDAAALQERDRHRKEVDVAWKRCEKLQQLLSDEQRRHAASRRALLRAASQLCCEQEASRRGAIETEAVQARCDLMVVVALQWFTHRCQPAALVAAPIRDSQLLRSLRAAEMHVQRLTDTLRKHNIDVDLYGGGDLTENGVEGEGGCGNVHTAVARGAQQHQTLRPATQGAKRRPRNGCHAPSSW